MTTYKLPQDLQSHANDSSSHDEGGSAQLDSPTGARDENDKSGSYRRAVDAFKHGHDYSANPSAYAKRRATETVDDDGQIGPRMTVRQSNIK
jgi:hypothetical protein